MKKTFNTGLILIGKHTFHNLTKKVGNIMFLTNIRVVCNSSQE